MPVSQEQIDIAEVKDTRGYQDWRARVAREKERFYTTLAREMFVNPDRVTEAALREKQAFWRGADYALNIVLFEAMAVDREFSKTKDEDE
jgi:hypothetical protein